MLRQSLNSMVNKPVESPAGASGALTFQESLCIDYIASDTLLLEALASTKIGYSLALVGLYLPAASYLPK